MNSSGDRLTHINFSSVLQDCIRKVLRPPHVPVVCLVIEDGAVQFAVHIVHGGRDSVVRRVMEAVDQTGLDYDDGDGDDHDSLMSHFGSGRVTRSCLASCCLIQSLI